MKNLIEEYLKKENTTDSVRPINFKSILDFAIKVSEDEATFEEYVAYDILLDLKDILFKREKYICIYLGRKTIKQLVKNINDIQIEIEIGNIDQYNKKIQKLFNEKFIFINKNIKDNLFIKTENEFETKLILGKDEKNIKRLSNIISKILNKPIQVKLTKGVKNG